MRGIIFVCIFFGLITGCASVALNNKEKQVMLESEYWFRFDWTNKPDKIIGVDADLFLYDVKNKSKLTIFEDTVPGVMTLGVSWFLSNT